MSKTDTRDDVRTATTTRREELTSIKYLFDDEGELLEVRDDGRLVLDIDGEEVSGTHYHPDQNAHRVSGKFRDTTPPSITLKSEDELETYFGVLLNGGTQYIGHWKVRPVLKQQEEGTWVGTKT